MKRLFTFAGVILLLAFIRPILIPELNREEASAAVLGEGISHEVHEDTKGSADMSLPVAAQQQEGVGFSADEEAGIWEIVKQGLNQFYKFTGWVLIIFGDGDKTTIQGLSFKMVCWDFKEAICLFEGWDKQR